MAAVLEGILQASEWDSPVPPLQVTNKSLFFSVRLVVVSCQRVKTDKHTSGNAVALLIDNSEINNFYWEMLIGLSTVQNYVLYSMPWVSVLAGPEQIY